MITDRFRDEIQYGRMQETEMMQLSPIEEFKGAVEMGGETVEVDRNANIFLAGELAETLDLLLSGSVRLWYPRAGNDPLLVGVVRAGQLLEPGPFFLGGVHGTSASTITPCRILRVRREALEEAMARRADLRVPLLELLRDAMDHSIRVARFLRTAHLSPAI
ncbi:MAG TPA: cyclic nucleotide-binding domain-containing protein [Thermoanaerobaculia bacterium]|nr:cyclic nucleotide-binding domain-containing protein [Thermoanaerobaculia bacterium]